MDNAPIKPSLPSTIGFAPPTTFNSSFSLSLHKVDSPTVPIPVIAPLFPRARANQFPPLENTSLNPNVLRPLAIPPPQTSSSPYTPSIALIPTRLSSLEPLTQLTTNPPFMSESNASGPQMASSEKNSAPSLNFLVTPLHSVKTYSLPLIDSIEAVNPTQTPTMASLSAPFLPCQDLLPSPLIHCYSSFNASSSLKDKNSTVVTLNEASKSVPKLSTPPRFLKLTHAPTNLFMEISGCTTHQIENVIKSRYSKGIESPSVTCSSSPSSSSTQPGISSSTISSTEIGPIKRTYVLPPSTELSGTGIPLLSSTLIQTSDPLHFTFSQSSSSLLSPHYPASKPFPAERVQLAYHMSLSLLRPSNLIYLLCLAYNATSKALLPCSSKKRPIIEEIPDADRTDISLALESSEQSMLEILEQSEVKQSFEVNQSYTSAENNLETTASCSSSCSNCSFDRSSSTSMELCDRHVELKEQLHSWSDAPLPSSMPLGAMFLVAYVTSPPLDKSSHHAHSNASPLRSTVGGPNASLDARGGHSTSKKRKPILHSSLLHPNTKIPKPIQNE